MLYRQGQAECLRSRSSFPRRLPSSDARRSAGVPPPVAASICSGVLRSDVKPRVAQPCVSPSEPSSYIG